MARLIIILVFSGCLSSLKAQEFLPIVKEGAIWSQHAAWGAFPDPTYHANWTYEFIGDTLINSTQYKKLIKVSGNGNSMPLGYVGAMREDSGRVYYLAVYDSSSQESNWCLYFNEEFIDSVNFVEERLIYDFNLTIGDTLYNQTIVWIDSVDLGDGVLRKRVDVSYQGHPAEYWIEGIGSGKGLIECGCHIFENEYNLNCYQDSSINYPDPCLNLSVQKPEQPRWTLSPNPATDVVKLIGFEGRNAQIQVRNMLGESVLATSIRTDGTVDIRSIDAGIYTVSIHQPKAPIETRRLVIVR